VCSKHVENWNKHIRIRIVHHVGYLQELYGDARSAERKILHVGLSDLCHLDVLHLIKEPCLTSGGVSAHVTCYHALTSAVTFGNYRTFVFDANFIIVFHSISNK
jgi:hypothetical protein